MKKIFSHKNKILAGSLLIVAGTLVSCKKLIEIPPNPPTQITREQQFADSATTIAAVAGIYTYTRSGGGIPYSDGSFAITTALSAHEIIGGSGDLPQFNSYSLTPLNSYLTSLWSAPYASLYQVNDVLGNITDNKNLSASFIKQITGEMEVVRAFYYFNLVNLFGGVPLVTTTDYAANAQLPRAAASAVYAQILTDLNDAIKKLPATYPSAGHVRPNLYTAIALQAKVNLYLGNWQAAYNEADSVIKSNLYAVTGTPLSDVFLSGSAEAIWQLPNTTSNQGIAEPSQFIPLSATVTPTYVVADSLINRFDTGDLRLTNWLGKNVVNGNTLYYPFKYKQRIPGTPAENYMMLRLGEMYLIRAEAAAQLGNLTEALADVNIIRLRAGLGASTAASQTAVLAAITKERRIELCFEGANRWFDLNRTNNDTKYPASGQAAAVLTGYQSYNALYPLPQAQLQLNSQLIQNPGYH